MKIPGLIGSFLATAALAITVGLAQKADDIIINTRTKQGQEKKNYVDPEVNSLLGVGTDGVTPMRFLLGAGFSFSTTGNNTTISAAGTGGGGGGPLVNLGGAGMLTWGTDYYDTFSSNRTLNLTGIESGHVSIDMIVTAPLTLTIESSIVIPGNGTPINSLAMNAGRHFIRWDAVNGEKHLVHTALVTVNSNVGTFGNATHTPVITVNAQGQITAVTLVATSGGGGGPVAPTLTSATINGSAVTVNWSEAVKQGASYSDSHITITGSTTGAMALTYATGNNTATHTYTAAPPAVAGETTTLYFSGAGNSLEGSTGVDVATIPSGSVTNSTPPPAGTYVVEEYFEGTGTPSGWAATGSTNFDYATSPMQGAQGMRLATTTSDSATTTTGHNLPAGYGRMKFRRDTLPTGGTSAVLLVRDSASTLLFYASLDTTGHFSISGGTASTNAISAGVDYYVWFSTIVGTGANGVMNLWFQPVSSGTTRPANGSAFHVTKTDGTNTTNFDRLVFSSGADGACIVDEVLIDDVDSFGTGGGGGGVSPLFFWGAEATPWNNAEFAAGGTYTGSMSGTPTDDTTTFKHGAHSGAFNSVVSNLLFSTGTGSGSLNHLQGSLGFWVYSTALATTSRLFVCLFNPGDDEFFIAHSNSDATRLQWGYKAGGVGFIRAISTGSPMVVNTWYYVIMRWNKTTGNYFLGAYNADGSILHTDLVTSSTTVGTWAGTPSIFYVGENAGFGGARNIDSFIVSSDPAADLLSIRNNPTPYP